MAHSENLRVTYHAQKVGGSELASASQLDVFHHDTERRKRERCGGQICTKLPGFRRSLSDRMGFRRGIADHTAI